MVGDNDQLNGLLGEKRALDILSVATERIVRASRCEVTEETSTDDASVKDKKRRRTTMSSSLGKRLKIDDCENQDPKQNPNRVASSPRLCRVESKRRGQVVSNKAVKRKKAPVRRKAPVREREVVGERRTPEWLVNVMREEKGGNAKLIIKKVLFKTDVNEKQARLLIPWNQIEDMDFLMAEELNIIDEHFKEHREKGVDFTLVDSRRQRWELNLRRWDMKNTSNYVFITGWNKIVAGNRLKAGHEVRVWTFRSEERLFFAFVPPDPAPGPGMALAPAPALPLAPDPAPYSPPALVVTRDSEELYISQGEAQEESDRIIPVPDKDLEGLNLLGEVCEERTRLEDLQQVNRRSSLVSVTELDLELPVVTRDQGQNSSAM